MQKSVHRGWPWPRWLHCQSLPNIYITNSITLSWTIAKNIIEGLNTIDLHL